MNELKNCPFCGKDGAGTKWHHGYWSVKCSYFAEDNYPVRCNQDWGEFATEEEAIIAWNTRTKPAQQPLTLEELREMDGEPVWIHGIENDDFLWEGWHIWRYESMILKDYNKTWLAYRQKPNGGEA